ncbi:DNA adenine methylase [Entomomonas sp. E2T0]|uniref:DNA adenine methylase n=1 Tax=Entomomonas sp. E2T0 TaxID=2930213 RepID=UPI002228252F|nr:DNA adenine methylase [Entomomonas sp. E2T0]UYZ82881.1 DNA adenine methylase [Entomomonas sp. E2T0]
MPVTDSPLRYPGGKSSIMEMVNAILYHNNLNNGYYIEPYAGGAGLALSLLFEGHVNEVFLNDLDRSIWAFWYSILNDTENFINRIQSVEVTMDEWYRQKEIQQSKAKVDSLVLGFSSFFLNRTNRSGILKGGPIGGYQQESEYKIDCRFNKTNLIKRILKVAQYREKIHIYNLDAIDFVQTIEKDIANKQGLFCIDPPYYKKGKLLYENFYTLKEHQYLAKFLMDFDYPWILTSDNEQDIKNLYSCNKRYNFYLGYTAAEKRKGTELLVVSDNISLPMCLRKNKIVKRINKRL